MKAPNAAVDLARPEPHIIWGELAPYNAICPKCDARYMRRGPSDGYIDIITCDHCEASRDARVRINQLREELRSITRCRRTDARRRYLEESLLSLGGKLPGRRAQKLR